MKLIVRFLVSFAAVCALWACTRSSAATPAEDSGKVVVAYVTSWSDVMPDPALVTHVNYAFGHVSDSFDSVRISNEPRFAQIAGMKKDNSDMKVMLSIGGWGSGRFSEMADNDSLRASFARDCRRIVDQYGIDGIDIDWEYPGSSAAGISSSPNDRANFTLLMRDIREAIGDDKLLTLAGNATARDIEFRDIMPYVDFVNVMSYDLGWAPQHNSPLYRSEHTSDISCHDAIQAHIAAGVPAGRLVMGMPFYGHRAPGEHGCDFKNFSVPEGCKIVVDSVAMVPFVVDSLGNYILGYDDATSIGLKCDYINEHDLLGGMYWDYAGDDSLSTLAKTVAGKLKGQPNKTKVLVLNEGGGQHGPFTQAAMSWLRDYAANHDFAVTEIRNAKPITDEFLKDYAMVIQLDFPPYTWPEAAENAFVDYIDNGKGAWIGFHHATLLGEFDGYPMWNWFSDFMGGVKFQNYVAETADGTVNVENATHPVMAGVGQSFVLPSDEWYTYNVSPRGNVEVLANVDEESYVPASNIKMGDHPVVWVNPDKKARNVYFQFGHSPKLLQSDEFVQMFSNAIEWGLGRK